MSRVFADGQNIQIPAASIFDNYTELTIACWVNLTEYSEFGAPIVVKAPNGNYLTYLWINANGTLLGAAGGRSNILGYVDALTFNPGHAGTGFAVNDTGTCSGHGDGLCKYRVAAVGALGVITDLNGVVGFGGSGYAANDTGALLPGGSQPGSGINGQYKVIGTTTQHEFAVSTSNEIIPLNEFTHVAMTWSSADGTVRLYINGVQATYSDQTVSTELDDSAEGYEIGTDGFGDDTTGAVAEVAIGNTVLSGVQIAALAASTDGAVDVFGASLIGYWHLCGEDSPEPDASGNGNDGVLSDPPPTQGEDSPGWTCGPAPTTPTFKVIGVGEYGGDTLPEAFYNPDGMDLLQVVNEGGNIVWNLSADGVSTFLPDSPTSKALVGRYEGESFVLAFPNPYGYDVFQVIGQGDNVAFWVNSDGNAFFAE